MSKELDRLEMWVSPLTNAIYVGKVNARSNIATSKRDITHLAISVVAEHFARSDKYSALIRPDGELRWSKKEDALTRKAAEDMLETLEAIRDVAMNPDNRGQKTVKQQCALMDAIYNSVTKTLSRAKGESSEGDGENG